VSYGLTPRPQLGSDELAALLAAAEAVLQRERAPVSVDPVPVWRFSGRWFNAAPFSNRRPRLN
jgi:hypothetical protein